MIRKRKDCIVVGRTWVSFRCLGRRLCRRLPLWQRTRKALVVTRTRTNSFQNFLRLILFRWLLQIGHILFLKISRALRAHFQRFVSRFSIAELRFEKSVLANFDQLMLFLFLSNYGTRRPFRP